MKTLIEKKISTKTRIVIAVALCCIVISCAVMTIAWHKAEKEKNVPTASTSEKVLDDMADIDDIVELEAIISDSSLLNGTGDKAWKSVGKGMLRIKNGDKYYLRKTTKNGMVTDFTYYYE